MGATVTIVNLVPAFLTALEIAVGEAVGLTGEEVADAMRDEMQAQKSGEVHGSHRASAPGEAPATLRGDLMGTIKSEMVGPTSADVSAGDASTQYLVEDLEFGSPGGMIAPRPLVLPAAELAKGLLKQNVTTAVQSVTG